MSAGYRNHSTYNRSTPDSGGIRLSETTQSRGKNSVPDINKNVLFHSGHGGLLRVYSKAIMENELYKMYWDRPVITDRPTPSNTPDLIVLQKSRKTV